MKLVRGKFRQKTICESITVFFLANIDLENDCQLPLADDFVKLGFFKIFLSLYRYTIV